MISTGFYDYEVVIGFGGRTLIDYSMNGIFYLPKNRDEQDRFLLVYYNQA